MKKACIVVSKPYQKNRLFDRDDNKLNRDDCLVPFFFLREELAKHNIELSTQDINPISNSDFVIYNEMPKSLPKESQEKSFLLILESPIIISNSWERKRFAYFKKIFSWNDDVPDDDSFVKVNYSFELPKRIKTDGKRNKLCTLISAHKRSNKPMELYSERIKAIRWFEDNAPESFDLYGIGWDKPAFTGLFKIIKKIPFLHELIPFKNFSSYKGAICKKKDILEKYDFAICYENVFNLNGYITEKIFDCFFAGTIPIYLGARNISDYIPKNCFIDMRDFKSYDSLFKYIVSLSDQEIQQKRVNIENFLKSERSNQFSVSKFATTITHEILKEI